MLNDNKPGIKESGPIFDFIKDELDITPLDENLVSIEDIVELERTPKPSGNEILCKSLESLIFDEMILSKLSAGLYLRTELTVSVSNTPLYFLIYQLPALANKIITDGSTQVTNTFDDERIQLSTRRAIQQSPIIEAMYISKFSLEAKHVSFIRINGVSQSGKPFWLYSGLKNSIDGNTLSAVLYHDVESGFTILQTHDTTTNIAVCKIIIDENIAPQNVDEHIASSYTEAKICVDNLL